MPTFAQLDLSGKLLTRLDELGYSEPTPIQSQAIGPLLDGMDVLGVAQTGTGKTAAFSLPILELMRREFGKGRPTIRALVLAPTRELAIQIHEAIESYGVHTGARCAVIFGGVKQHSQVQSLRRGVDILVATPGRLLDLHNQGLLHLDRVGFFVLDEADRMLDMGFIHDLRRIEKLVPDDRQTLLFSATMPPEIAKLAADFLEDPVRIEVTPQATPVERITQQVMFVEKGDKKALLMHLLDTLPIDRAMVFSRTKHGADRVAKLLVKKGYKAAAIHGNKSQNQRTRALDGFRDGSTPVLIATDVASRGIDVEGITHVINMDLPNESESYVHRIGRTARAGESGVAISFCDQGEGGYLREIEQLTGVPLIPVMDQPFHNMDCIPPARLSDARKAADAVLRARRARVQAERGPRGSRGGGRGPRGGGRGPRGGGRGGRR